MQHTQDRARKPPTSRVGSRSSPANRKSGRIGTIRAKPRQPHFDESALDRGQGARPRRRASGPIGTPQFYSCRSASIGSRRAARRVRKISLKNTPITPEKANENAMIARGGGKGDLHAIGRDARERSPSAMPPIPPSKS